MSHLKEDVEEPTEQNRIKRPPTLPYYVPTPVKPFGPPVVTVRNVGKAYNIRGRDDTVVALKNISLDENSEFYSIHQGEFIMIRGPSGGGKTTMLNILGTIDKPTSGQVYLFDRKIDSESTDSELAQLRLESIGFVFQTFNLLATLSAFENVELPMTILGKLTKKQRRKRTLDLLKSVGLQDRIMHLPSELSGGEQQRVTIARALSNTPSLLLLDEPTGDLDTSNTIQIMDLIMEINLQGTTCIMVTHNPDLECYADRIFYLQDGTIKKQIINTRQTKLNEVKYSKYLNLKDELLQREQEEETE